jgi:hypothetical protein
MFDTTDASSNTSNSLVQSICQSRDSLRERCWRQDKARYAVKRAHSHHTTNNKPSLDAVLDLAAEAKFLANIAHPNIVRLRATVGKPGQADFMMVLDHLHLTLADQMLRWKKLMSELNRFRKYDRGVMQDIMVEQLVCAFDVARALAFLHRNK